MNSTANIHRRFRLLFTLPSTTATTALLLAVSSPLILAISLIGRTQPDLIPPSYLLFEVAVFLSVIIEYTVLNQNPVATFRRLAFISVITNILWLASLLIGALFSLDRLLSFVTVGAFLAATLRLLIFGSIFFTKPYLALPLAALQPVLLTGIMTAGSDLFGYLGQRPLLLGGGFLLLASVLVYLELVNRSSSGILPAPALTMFQAFLRAWIVEEPGPLERILERSSSKTTVMTSIITFNTDGVRPMIVVPEIHPGPFYPIGSSNLPHQLHQHFADQGFLPLILHGVSGHELNLVSKSEVEHLLESYEHPNILGDGATCTRPLTVRSNRAIANGLAFGNYPFVFLTLSPYGMEDFPREIKKPLEKMASVNGFRHLLLVDTHNSQGNRIGEVEAADAVDAAEKMLRELSKAEQHPFKVGFAHSSELGVDLARDIGPAGVGVILFEIERARFALLAIDANNARRGLREETLSSLGESGITAIELCTSDTHVTAGKVLTTHGYIALGDNTPTETLINIIRRLYERSVERLSESHFDVKSIETEVRTVGGRMLEDISTALDSVIGTARRGGLSLTTLSLLLFLSSLLL